MPSAWLWIDCAFQGMSSDTRSLVAPATEESSVTPLVPVRDSPPLMASVPVSPPCAAIGAIVPWSGSAFGLALTLLAPVDEKAVRSSGLTPALISGVARTSAAPTIAATARRYVLALMVTP